MTLKQKMQCALNNNELNMPYVLVILGRIIKEVKNYFCGHSYIPSAGDVTYLAKLRPRTTILLLK